MDRVLETFHPLVAGWFCDRFGAPTEPQRIGWPKIAAGEDVLIAAPTGSGKTLAAFLSCLDQLVRRGLEGPLGDHTEILYISPLKALSNDVQRNLEAPLGELAARAAREGIAFPPIRVAVRTGDTPVSERAKMAKHPPHILVTTPESLFILLTTVKGRAALGRLRTVIVDEIHAVAGDKRGCHLALSLERLDRLVRQTTGTVPVRVGLSATQRPIERIARLLVGSRRPMPHIVDAGHRRELDLAIEITDDELAAVASNEQFGRVFDRIAELVAQHRSTIVFVNTRRLVERTAAALEQRLGEEHVVAHHGSMSRALRLAAEQKLKHGQVKCAVATASLELSDEVSSLRGEIDTRLATCDHDTAAAWAASETGMPMRAAQQAIAYLAASRAALGALPRRDLIIAERFFDEGGGMQLVLHAPLGGRINRAWGLALRKKFCVTFDFELQAAATDDGIVNG